MALADPPRSSLPLSVAIICKNSEATIRRTLVSVAGLAEEVVAVDSGSTDGTIAMLERCEPPARIIRAEWKGYVATKQMALEACTREWVLCLDSDESLTAELRASIERVLGGHAAAGKEGGDGGEGGEGRAGYAVNRKVFYRGRPLNFAWQPEWRLRLVRRGGAVWTGLDPHDRLELVAAGEGGRGGRGGGVGGGGCAGWRATCGTTRFQRSRSS
jgi:glycosyltransferase involved in cell wall biosynthesis